jgi:hypothetical protein
LPEWPRRSAQARRGPAAEELGDGAVADTVAGGGGKVGDWRQANDETGRDDRIGAGSARWQRRPARDPEGEMPAGGVPHHGDVVRVEAMVESDGGKLVDRGRDVRQCSWPATTRLPDSGILDVPHGHATRGKIGRQRIHQVEAVRLAPETAMDEDDHR